MRGAQRTFRGGIMRIVGILVHTLLFWLAPFMVAHSQCRDGNTVITSVTIEITADDISGACFPLTVTIGGRSEVFANPGVAEIEINCPRCSLSYSITSGDPAATCRASGSISTENTEVTRNLSNGASSNAVIFVLTVETETVELPSPVTQIIPSDSLEFCAGNTIQFVGVSDDGFNSETFFTWHYSYDNITYYSVGDGSSSLDFQLPNDVVSPSTLFIRANTYSDLICNVRAYGAEEPENLFVKFYPQPPDIISATGIAPNCPDGEGSISVVHSDAFEPGTTFIYTLTQYEASPDGDCDELGLPGTSINCDDFQGSAFVTNYCGPGQVSNFCSGFIETIAATLSSHAESDRTVVIDQDLLNGGTPGNNLRLRPGVYSLEIEAMTEPGYIVCIKRFYVEIPMSEYTPVQINQPVVAQLPLCSGGNEGALNFSLSGGLAPFDWRIFQIDSLHAFDSALNQQNFTTKRLLRFSENNLYRVTVNDGCTNDSTLQATEIETRLTADGNSDLTILTNELQSDLTIDCYDSGIGDGVWTVTVVDSELPDSLTYQYSLFKGSLAIPVNLDTIVYSDTIAHTFSHLGLEHYSVLVNSSNGCSGTAQESFSFPDNINGTFSFLRPCPNTANAQIEFTRTSGSDSIVFFINDLPATGEKRGDVFTIYNLEEGEKIIKVTDLCLESNPVNLVSTITSDPYDLEALPQLRFEDDTTLTNLVHGDTITLACAGDLFYGGRVTYADNAGEAELLITKDDSEYLNWILDGRTMILAGLGPGNYSITVQDTCQTSASISFVVQEPDSLDVVFTAQDLTCAGGASGKIEVSVSGGTPGSTTGGGQVYTIELFNNNSNDQITNTAACNEEESNCAAFNNLPEDIPFRIEVTDANGCLRVFNGPEYIITLQAPEQLVLEDFALADLQNTVTYMNLPYVQCKGDSNVVANFSAYGGTLPYRFFLSRANTQPWPMPYDSSSIGHFENLSAGEYTLWLRDHLACSADTSYQFTIYESVQSLSASLEAIQYAHGANTSCYDSLDAAVSANVSGGIVPYAFILSGVNSDFYSESEDRLFDDLPALTADQLNVTYQIDVYDSLGCYVQTDEASRQITLVSPEPVSFDVDVLSEFLNGYDILCFADSAVVAISSIGGHFPGHSFTITDVESHAVVESGQIDQQEQVVEFFLNAGNFEIELADSLGCAAEPLILPITEPFSKVQIQLDTVMFPKCIDGFGEIRVHGAGGVSGNPGSEYQFRIRRIDEVEYDPTVLYGDSVVFFKQANLYEPRSYEIEVQDANGCLAFDTVTMIANPEPLALGLVETISPSCYGASNGSIEIVATNVAFTQSGTYFIHVRGGHLPSDSTLRIETSEQSYTISSLEATDIYGNLPFNIWLEDRNACTYLAQQYVENISVPSHDTLLMNLLPASRLQESCALQQDGAIVVSFSGGVEPYSCSFDGLNFFNLAENDSVLRNGLSSGLYHIFVRDSLFDDSQPGCEKHASYSIAEGRWVMLDAQISNVSCKGMLNGAIDLNVAIENLIYPEALQPDSVFIHWTREKFANDNFSDAEDLIDIASGIYNVTVDYKINNVFCHAEESYTVFEPAERFAISDVKVYDAMCGRSESGQAVVSVDGGWPSQRNFYRFENDIWYPFDDSKLLLRDVHSGERKITVRQSTSACIDSTSFVVNEKSLAVSLESAISPSCPGIDDGAIVVKANLSDVFFSIDSGQYQQQPVFVGVAAGNHVVRARHQTDTLCASPSLIVSVNEAPECVESELQAFVFNVRPVSCESANDGQGFVVAQGGLPPYKYWWNGIEGTYDNVGLSKGVHSVVVADRSGASIELVVEIGVKPGYGLDTLITKASCFDACDGSITLVLGEAQSDYNIVWQDGDSSFVKENLCVGEYACAIVDQQNANCVANYAFNISSYPPLAIELLNNKAPTCFGGGDGVLAVKATGGSGSFSYVWSNGIVSHLNNGLRAGTYSVTVSDNVLGCQAAAQFTISQPAPIRVSNEVVTLPTCFSKSDGKVQLHFENITNPLVIWQNGTVGSQIKDVHAGVFSYTVTNSSGCTFSDTVLVREPSRLNVDVQIQDAICFGGCDGKVSLSASGGSLPYSVVWSNGSKSFTQNNLCTGTYSFLVMDKNKCSVSNTVIIQSPPKLNVTLSSVMPKCYESSDGKIIADVTGGAGGYQYAWNTSETTPAIENLKKGRYSLIIRDKNGCQSSASAVLTHPTPLRLDVKSVVPPQCYGLTNGAIEVQASGSNGGYVYQWDDNSSGSSLQNIGSGDYKIICQDAKDCRISKVISLVDPPILAIDKVKLTHPRCVDSATGKVAIQVIGGNGAYTAQWSNGGNGLSISNLNEGTYETLIVDKNGCTISQNFTLVDPDPLVITGLPNEAIICQGTSLKLQPAGVWNQYEWRGPGNLYSTASSLICEVPGAYHLKVRDAQNCEATATTSLMVSATALTADFLRISEAVTFQPIIFIDITSPIPQQTEWLVPFTNGIISSKKSNGMLEVIFSEPGDYAIGLKSKLGDCESIERKVITIRDEKNNDGGRARNDELKVEVYPNPSHDELVVEIQSSGVHSGQVRLLSTFDHKTSRHQTFKGSQRILFDTTELISGVYFLIVESSAGNQIERIVVFH